MKNQTVKLDHINFTVQNLNESILWYQKIFHFEPVEKGVGTQGQPWCILKSGDSMLALTEYPDKKEYTGENFHRTNHFGLRLKDKVEWEKTVKDNSLKLGYGGPVHYPHSTSWYVTDPSGHEIEVAVWKDDKVSFPGVL